MGYPVNQFRFLLNWVPAREGGQRDCVGVCVGEDLEVGDGVGAESGAVEGDAVRAVGGVAGVHCAREEAVLGLAEPEGIRV